MLNIIVAPELPKLLVEQRGILTVDAQDATVSCRCPQGMPCVGIDVAKMGLAHRMLQQHVTYMGHLFLKRLALRGYELAGALRLHGPWPSYNYRDTVVDIDSSAWREAVSQDDPSKVVGLVRDREVQMQMPVLKDYRLIGMFLKTAVLTEVFIAEKKETTHATQSH